MTTKVSNGWNAWNVTLRLAQVTASLSISELTTLRDNLKRGDEKSRTVHDDIALAMIEALLTYRHNSGLIEPYL